MKITNREKLLECGIAEDDIDEALRACDSLARVMWPGTDQSKVVHNLNIMHCPCVRVVPAGEWDHKDTGI